MNIKKTIKAKGWTYDRLAEKMGISQPSLTSIVNGNPTLAKLKSLADAMGITLSELLADDGEMTITCPHCGKEIPIRVTPIKKEEG